MIAALDVPRKLGGMKPPVTNAVTCVPPCQGDTLEPLSLCSFLDLLVLAYR